MKVKLVSNKRELKRFANYKNNNEKSVVAKIKYRKLAEFLLGKKKIFAVLATEDKVVKGKLIFGFVSDKFNKQEGISCYFSNMKYDDEQTLLLMFELVFVEMKKYGIKTIKGPLQPFNVVEDYGLDDNDECNLILSKMGFKKEKNYYAISSSNFESTNKNPNSTYTIKNFDIKRRDLEINNIINILSKDKFKEETQLVSKRFFVGRSSSKQFNFKHIKIAYDMLGNPVGFIAYIYDPTLKSANFIKKTTDTTLYIPLLCSKLNGGYIDMCEKLLDAVKEETKSFCSKLTIFKLPQDAMDENILKVLDATVISKNAVYTKIAD